MPGKQLDFVGVVGVDGIRQEWAALAKRLDAVPTAAPAWGEAWWRAFGRGELRTYVGRRESELVAVLPLCVASRDSLSSPSNVHTPVFEALAVDPADLDLLLRAALADAPGGIQLGQIDNGGSLAAAIGRLGQSGGVRTIGADPRLSSRVEADSWTDFEATLRKKRLSDCRRGKRKLEAEGEVIFEVWDGEDQSRAFEEMLRLEATPWKLESGTAISQDDATRSFYADLMRLAAPGGPCRLAFLRVGGKATAMQFMITGGGRRFGLKTGFDPDYAKLSVGVIHLFDELRIALDAGLAFELGTGDEALKQELRTTTWTLEALAAFPSSLRGAFGRRLATVRLRAYERARHSRSVRRLYERFRHH